MTTRYAKVGDAHIAYRTFGDGSPDILYMLGEYIPVDQLEDEPRMAHVHRRLASMGRMIVFNRRGVGLSDPTEGDPTIEHHVEDAVAVLNDVGTEKVFVMRSRCSPRASRTMSGSGHGGRLRGTAARLRLGHASSGDNS